MAYGGLCDVRQSLLLGLVTYSLLLAGLSFELQAMYNHKQVHYKCCD
jgi:hypothetical protein